MQMKDVGTKENVIKTRDLVTGSHERVNTNQTLELRSITVFYEFGR